MAHVHPSAHSSRLINFIHPSDLYEILSRCGDYCYEHKSVTADPGKTLVRVPGGLFLVFVQNVIMYVFIVVFHSADFKFTYTVT